MTCSPTLYFTFVSVMKTRLLLHCCLQQINPLNTITQSFKCFAGYILKQRDDNRGNFAMCSKGLTAQWKEEALELYRAFALSALEGRIPITRRTGLEEMYRLYQSNFSQLPFLSPIRQMFYWSITSKSHVPKKFAIPSMGRGYNRAMVEAEWKMCVAPETVFFSPSFIFFDVCVCFFRFN